MDEDTPQAIDHTQELDTILTAILGNVRVKAYVGTTEINADAIPKTQRTKVQAEAQSRQSSQGSEYSSESEDSDSHSQGSHNSSQNSHEQQPDQLDKQGYSPKKWQPYAPRNDQFSEQSDHSDQDSDQLEDEKRQNDIDSQYFQRKRLKAENFHQEQNEISKQKPFKSGYHQDHQDHQIKKRNFYQMNKSVHSKEQQKEYVHSQESLEAEQECLSHNQTLKILDHLYNQLTQDDHEIVVDNHTHFESVE